MTPLVWRWFVAAWRHRPGWVVWLTLSSVANAALITAFPWFWQTVIDEVRGGAAPARVDELGLWLLVVGVAQSVLYAALQGSRTLVNAWIQVDTRRRVFSRLVDWPDEAFSRWAPGDLVTRLTDDAGEKSAWFLCSGVFRALEAALIVVTSFAAMLWIDPGVGLASAVPLPALVVAQAFLQRRLAARFVEAQSAVSALNDEIEATFGAIRAVQAGGLQGVARARFGAASARARAADFRASVLQQAVMLMYGHGWTLAVAVLLAVGGPAVLRGELTVGQLSALEGLLMSMVWPMFDVGMYVSKAGMADVSLGRLEALLAEPIGAGPAVGQGVVPEAASALVVEDVTVDGDGRPRLDAVSLSVRPGELLAVAGVIGAGKSTLMAVLSGALAARRGGTVRVGDVPLDQIDDRHRGEVVAYVPQDPVVLSGTVRDNITLGRTFSDAAVGEAVSAACLDNDLRRLASGLDTRVGDRGVTLSGGQQQRVALARALLGRPRVLLLDDATAALDAETEAAFFAALERALPDVAAVIVTHRASTLERADRVLVLEAGRVAQQGPHDALVNVDGPYRRIYAESRRWPT